jgi:hypothetical protein
MYFHKIHYQLGCRECKSLRTPGITMFKSEKEDTEFSKEHLKDIMDNFSEIDCDNCGTGGYWTCLKIYINDKDNVYSQVRYNIFKENGRIKGNREGGVYSQAQLTVSIMAIREKIEDEKYNFYPPSSNGQAFILVDFSKDEPYVSVSVFELEGITIEELTLFLDTLTGKKATKGISSALKTRLEAVFDNFKLDNINPLVIAHLKDNNNKVNIYLIAKDPDEEMYYGIIESEFVGQREIVGIPLANINAMEVDEVLMQPFRAKPYIDDGIKE